MTRVREAQPESRAGATPARGERARFAAEVREQLTRTPRQLPTRYLYDELGSALFEAICQLPWYRVTRAEERLLLAARDDIARVAGPLDAVIELGPGSGAKLERLLTAPALRGRALDVHLVDLSASALEMASRALSRLPGVDVAAHEAEYLEGVRAATSVARGRRLVLFLGSNIGNFDPAESRAFLAEVRATLGPSDGLLLGVDLVKPEPELRLAYDDPLGVTAAFNQNLLVRINRELGADFDLPCWAHHVVWDEAASRVEMHLVALRPQRVRVPAADLVIDVAAGETIWTESSYKYRPADVDDLLVHAGFAVAARWIDRADGFALTLARAV